MKRIFLALVLLCPSFVFSAGSNVPLETANIDLHDKASLQRGFEHYQAYCAGCHSMQYQRYERVSDDLGIDKQVISEQFLPAGVKIGELMKNAIPPNDAATWFGAVPPDLTLVSRVRGEDWVYSYLKGFYQDPSRPFGVNNVVFPMVGMPHVLQPLQGVTIKQPNGKLVSTGGQLTPQEYDNFVRDLTGFLAYSADPVKLEREGLGKWVLAFLAIFFILAFLLKKEYWKDVH